MDMEENRERRAEHNAPQTAQPARVGETPAAEVSSSSHGAAEAPAVQPEPFSPGQIQQLERIVAATGALAAILEREMPKPKGWREFIPSPGERAAMEGYPGWSGLGRCADAMLFSRADCERLGLNPSWGMEAAANAIRQAKTNLVEIAYGLSLDDGRYVPYRVPNIAEALYREVLGDMAAAYQPQPRPELVRAIREGIGLECGQFLDPAAGLGAFGKEFLRDEGKGLYVEQDIVKGMMLKALMSDNPNVEVAVAPYHRVVGSCVYDMVATRIPASHKPDFALRTTMSVGDGGIVVIVAPTCILNQEIETGLKLGPKSNAVLGELLQRADLISASRLPNGVFDGAPGQADVLILQRNDAKLHQCRQLGEEFHKAFTPYECRILDLQVVERGGRRMLVPPEDALHYLHGAVRFAPAPGREGKLDAKTCCPGLEPLATRLEEAIKSDCQAQLTPERLRCYLECRERGRLNNELERQYGYYHTWKMRVAQGARLYNERRRARLKQIQGNIKRGIDPNHRPTQAEMQQRQREAQAARAVAPSPPRLARRSRGMRH